MRAFGFLSFGHYGHGRGPGDPSARDMLHEAIELSVGADEIGVNGAYFRVHHFARQPPRWLVVSAGLAGTIYGLFASVRWVARLVADWKS